MRGSSLMPQRESKAMKFIVAKIMVREVKVKKLQAKTTEKLRGYVTIFSVTLKSQKTFISVKTQD